MTTNMIMNFMGEGRSGPIGVDLIVLSKWSVEIPDYFVVVRAVLIALIWHSVNPLNFR